MATPSIPILILLFSISSHLSLATWGFDLLVGCVASCPQNCPFLEMVDDPEKVNACTTAFYEGQAAVMDPRESWVAKWLRVDNYLPGCYAITVTGQFDKEIEEELENRGCRWRCRPA